MAGWLVFLTLTLLVGTAVYAAGSGVVGQVMRKSERRSQLEQARVKFSMDDFESAREILDRLWIQADLNSKQREEVRYRLGRCQEELGQWDQATLTYRSYIRDYSTSQPNKLTGWLADVRARFSALGERSEVAEAPPIEPEAAPAPDQVVATASTKVPRALVEGRKLGDFVLTERLGEGGFAEVWRANIPVAVKVFRNPDTPMDRERLKALSNIQSDRIVRTLAVSGPDEEPYVVLDLVDGEDLRNLLKREGGKLPPERALGLMREVLLGLADAHREGVVHLDLKPENVLIDKSGRVRLTDFDLGRLIGEEAVSLVSRSLASEDVSLRGTVAYMSPEQRQGQVPDHRSDIYTAGLLLFELLVGELPQPGDRPSQFISELPDQVDAIFDRAYTRLDRRYATAEEMAADVEKARAVIAQGLEAPSSPPVAAEKAEEPPASSEVEKAEVPAPVAGPTRPPIETATVDESPTRAPLDEGRGEAEPVAPEPPAGERDAGPQAPERIAEAE